MFSIYLYSLLSVIIVSLVSLVGVFTLSLKEKVLRKYVFLLVSLAVGALLGDAFIHLIPESFEVIGNGTHVSLAVIAGILIFFILEKFLHWHHHQIGPEESEVKKIHPVGHMILISDGVHNFIDGLIIGVSYLVSIEVGIATTIAVILHEIPQEISDFGVLLHAGYSKTKALWINFLSALLAVLGAVVALVAGSSSEVLTVWLLPVAAGGFIYIALSDLIPEMHKTKHIKYSILQVVAVLVGIVAMLLLLNLE
ncbi:MAG: zinc and cadmium transporter [Candidatus Paceibacteria bacterium]|jgi:zinc and cadmium transporter